MTKQLSLSVLAAGLVVLTAGALRPALAQEGSAQAMADQAFERFDSNGSGDLDDGEFKQMVNAAMRQRGEDNLSGLSADEAFQKFDLNQDGIVDKSEMVFFMETMQSI